MHLPENLQSAIDAIVQGASSTVLRQAREALSRAYRESGSSLSVFADPAQRLAYLAARLPATYAAVHRAAQELPQGVAFRRVLDLGAGPGTAAWALLERGVEEVVFVERSADAIALGKQIMPEVRGEWVCQDMEVMREFPRADIAVMSYSLGELKQPERIVEGVWQAGVPFFLIVEPGTPRGYGTILRARERLIALGAHLVAPCPHQRKCPLQVGDWCHFSARLERTKLHRLLKEGSLGFEDEKFSYLIAARNPVEMAHYARILRHPNKGSGHVRLALCTEEGNREERVVTRKEKEVYKDARDAEWGDRWM